MLAYLVLKKPATYQESGIVRSAIVYVGENTYAKNPIHGITNFVDVFVKLQNVLKTRDLTTDNVNAFVKYTENVKKGIIGVKRNGKL